MFERRLVFTTLLLACGAPTLAAQAGASALQARRAELAARAESLRMVVDRLRAAEEDSGLVMDAHAGSLHMRTTATLQPIASEALEQAMRATVGVMGAEAGTLAARVTLTLQEERSKTQWSSLLPIVGPTLRETKERIVSASLSASLDGRYLSGVNISWPFSRDELAAAVVSMLERAAADGLPATLAGWMGRRLPLRDQPAEFWPDMYRSLATAEAVVVRRCASGDREACRLGFALDSIPVNRIAAWYDESDLPGLARTAGDPTLRSWVFRSMSTEDQEACTARGEPTACRRVVSLLPIEAFLVPMPDAARGELVRLAVQTGGARAIARLSASGDQPLAAQLSAAAGISADSLVGMWQRKVISARPASPLPDVTFVLASLACIAVCVAWAARGQPWK
jgi:hypothetical protein